jgi:hypothetical protein
MKRGQIVCSVALFFCSSACGGSKPPADDPSTVAPTPTASAAPTPSPDEDTPKPESDTAKPAKEEVVEPTFTPDMSVEDAINAIPQSAERVNVDQETLSKPLTDEGVYAPCKPGAAHFTLRVAVWRGKAVAIDLTTTPKNPKLAECLEGRIRELTWPVKVPSLNTVEYSM